MRLRRAAVVKTEPPFTGQNMDLIKARVVLGAIISPMIPPGAYFLGMTFVAGYVAQGPGHLEKLVPIALGFVLQSYLLSLVLGTPIVLALSKLNRLTVANILLSSFVAGVLAGLCF